MSDPAAAAAETAASAAAVAAEQAAVAAEEIAADTQPSPDALIAADVEIARQQEETERARIEARAAVRIAEAQNEEPVWLSDIRACLSRLETAIAALSPPSSIPPPSVETVIVTEPAGPAVVEAAGAIEEAPVVENGEVTPVLQEVPGPQLAPQPRGRRWT